MPIKPTATPNGARLGAWLLAFMGAPAISMAATIVTDVTVIDTATGAHSPGMAIVVEGDTIIRVAPSADVTPDDGDTVIDASGLYAIPGLNDMHTHALTSGDAETNLRLMLANGITGFRQMSSDPELVARHAEGGVTGPRPGPDALALPGAILNDGNVRSPEAAAEEIARQAAQGVDFVKILVENPAVFLAALDAAEAAGLPTAGHLPHSLPVEAAAARGMDAMEHLGPRETMLLSASTREDEFRAQIADTPPPPPPSAPPPPDFYARVIANPIPFTAPQQFERMFAMADSFDEERARVLARVLRDAGAWQVATLIRLRTMNHGDDPLYREDPNLAYIPAPIQALWQDIADSYAARIPDGAVAELDRLYETQMRLLAIMDEEGVPMMAGSDFGGQWLVAGFSLHQEFAELADAGLSPLRILQMATLDAGEFLGLGDRMGRIGAGMAADIVLLTADPVADSANLSAIAGVIETGTYHDRAALDAMLAR